MHQRRFDIDWLRAMVTVMMLLRHCARPFTNGWWHIKNGQLDFGLSLFVSVVDQWIMPLFFVLSAFSIYYALSRRTDAQFAEERLQRLFIPLIFGVLVLIPPQDYFERLSRAQFSGTLIAFLSGWLAGLREMSRGDLMGMTHHLWYLEILLIVSLVTLPLFRYLEGKTVPALSSRALGFLARPGGITVLGIPIAIVDFAISRQPYDLLRQGAGTWSFATYLAFFIAAYLIASDARLRAAVGRDRMFALLLAIATLLPACLFWLQPRDAQFAFPPMVRALNSWWWLMAILGFGSRYLNFTNRLLAYANEAVLPFYMLHQTVIVIIGFYVLGWSIGVPAKYAILSVTSFVVIVAVYHIVIRPANLLRYLFGMRLRASMPRVPAPG